MLFFWLTILSIVLVLSFLLAMRSLKNSQTKIKPSSTPQSLFLIRNPDQITTELLEKLHQTQTSLSFEKLFKGSEQALVLFGPKGLEQRLPELGLLELEDYLIPKEQTFSNKDQTKVNADQAFGWQIALQPGMDKPDLSQLNLGVDEQLFYQIILEPVIQKDEKLLKVTARAMVATKNKLDKVKLGKRIFNKINQSLEIESNDLQSSPQFFEKYQFRVPAGEKNFTIQEALKTII